MNAQEPTQNKPEPSIGIKMPVTVYIDKKSGKVEKIVEREKSNAPRLMEAPVKCLRCDKPLNTHKGWPDWCPTKPHGQAGSAKYGD